MTAGGDAASSGGAGEFAGRRCLLTGATGQLGAHLAARLVAAGAEVTVLARPRSDLWRLAGLLPRLSVLRGGLADLDSLKAEVEAARPEVVFHLAWEGVTGETRDSASQISVNVPATLALFELARGAGCGCFVGVGSQAEYGPHEGPLTEQTEPRPETAYGAAKLCAGLLVRELCRLAGMRYVWLRLLATYGPLDDGPWLIPHVIRALLSGGPLSLSAGTQLCDYLYVTDAAEAVALAGMRPGVEGVFNLSSGEAVRVRDLVCRLRDLIDPSRELEFGGLPTGAKKAINVWADPARLRGAAGWEPRVSLEEGLRLTVDWWRQRVAAT